MHKKSTISEISPHQATAIIKAICAIKPNPNDMAVVRIGCYFSQSILAKYAKTLNCTDFYTKSSINSWLKYLPIPTQNYIVLFDLPLANLDVFYKMVEPSFVIIEIVIAKDCSNKTAIKEFLKNYDGLLCYDIDTIKPLIDDLFFCSVDFDSANFNSGTAYAYYADFIPQPMQSYCVI